MKYAVNQFHLLLHMMSRPSRNRMDAKRSVELNGFYMNVMELFGKDGEVPPAWCGLYAWTALVKAAALFGNGDKEEGYETLDIAIRYCEKIKCFKNGDFLDTGKTELFGGIQYEYQHSVVLLPDGSKEPVSHDYRLNFCAETLLACLVARSGWEWFNSVRKEDRFKACIERARVITMDE